MKRIVFFLMLPFLTICSGNAQSINNQTDEKENIESEKILLLSDLKILEARAAKLNGPLARALAKTEIADAAWALDKDWAKKLLREAYELTFPEEKEQIELRNRPAGSPPLIPSRSDRARSDIRNRVLEIAKRDKELTNQLTRLGAERMGSLEEHLRDAVLATKAFKEGDKEGAAQYVTQSIAADPTQITAATAINEMAAKDRALADRLILNYIGRLRAFPLSTQNQSDIRVYSLLNILVLSPRSEQGPVQPPSAEVIRAYLSYMIESLDSLEQSEPGYLQKARHMLLSIWPSLQRYAPELTGAFMDLERRSRSSGDDSSLPTSTRLQNETRERYEKGVEEALAGDEPDVVVIDVAISKGDFVKARKMIDKIPDGSQKEQLIELVNKRESMRLAEKNDLLAAMGLAEKLNNATSILEVYPVLVRKCVAAKDQPCADALVRQAVKQLRRADNTPPILPAGIPVSAMATKQDFDPTLSALSKLTLAILPINDLLAFEILDEMVAAANASTVNTEQGRAGFDLSVFRKLAPKNEVRTRQAADNLKDPLREIVAITAIYQWRSEELAKKIKVNQ